MTDQQWNRLYFEEWVKREGLDLIRGHVVENVYTVDLKPWARTGGNAIQIQLDGTEELNAAYVQEIPPGKHTNPINHLYEELVFVLTGQGSTSVWIEGQPKQSFEWKAGSLFAIPLNVTYQHFNGSGSQPARYVSITTAPIIMNLIRNEDFIFNNHAVFPERYAGGEDYWSGAIKEDGYDGGDRISTVKSTNFIADLNAIQFEKSDHSVGSQGMSFELDNGVLGAHTAVFPGATFSKVHRHAPGAHVLWLRGEGYTLMWPDGGERVQVPWGPGSIVVPPGWWWHQQCVVGEEPAQELALKLRSKRNSVNRLSFRSTRNVKRGGSRMDYDDLAPEIMAEIRQRFEAACAERGTQPRMDVVYSA